MATCPVQWWTVPKGGDPEPTMRQRGRLGPRAGIPKRQLPNCHSCQRGALKPAWVLHQEGGGPKTPVCEGKGPENPGVAAPLHLPLVVPATAGTLWVDGRTRRLVGQLCRTPGQARRGHFHHVLQLGFFLREPFSELFMASLWILFICQLRPLDAFFHFST